MFRPWLIITPLGTISRIMTFIGSQWNWGQWGGRKNSPCHSNDMINTSDQFQYGSCALGCTYSTWSWTMIQSRSWIHWKLVEKSLFEGGCGQEWVTCTLGMNGYGSRPQNMFMPWKYIGKLTWKLPNDSIQYCMRYCLPMMRMILKGGAKNWNINEVVLDCRFGHAPRLHIRNVACEVSNETVQNWMRYDDLKLQPKKKWKISCGHTHVKNTVIRNIFWFWFSYGWGIETDNEIWLWLWNKIKKSSIRPP